SARVPAARVTRPERGAGRPAPGPIGSGKTDPARHLRTTSTPGSAPGRAIGTTTGGVPLERPSGPLPTRVQGTDPLPDEYASTLETGLSALGIDLPAGARDAIDGHVRLLLAWNRAINLTAIRDPVAAASLH